MFVCVSEKQSCGLVASLRGSNVKLTVIVEVIRKVDWSEILKQDESNGRRACRSVQMTARTHTHNKPVTYAIDCGNYKPCIAQLSAFLPLQMLAIQRTSNSVAPLAKFVILNACNSTCTKRFLRPVAQTN